MPNRIAVSLAAVIFSTTASLSVASEGWYATYESACDAAEKHELPLLIHFHASYCGPCRQMSSQVFSNREVQQQLRQGVAAVEVDVSRDPALAAQFGASTIPRDVVVYRDGTTETLNVGFKSILAYMSLLREVSARGAKISVPQIVKNTKIIGLEGFCPVRLLKDREWVSGHENLTSTYRGVTYFFSSKETQNLFLKAPSDYAPQNLGCDPIVLLTDARAVAGKIRFGAFFDDRLYLFSSEDNRVRFKQSPLKYTRIRHAVKADQLTGQRYN
ncbi:MAG: thioredoxin family protein [Fuerstiella sp.]|jgi:YHS domain-containing protein/thiol-disulfide isomerase/thioredoxin|nr:thioredoxin family protein [Fuerstiella sp.]